MPLIRKDTPGPSAPPEGDPRTALSDGTSDERWAAARSLARSPGGAGILASALANEKDTRVREAIFTSLASLKSAEAVEALLPLLRSEDAATRTASLDALGAMPETAASYVPRLLNDPDSDIRLLSCEIARRLRAPLATRLLCDLLDREEAANVCAAAVEVLSEVGGSDALPSLKKCAERFPDNIFLVFAVDVAARRIGEDRARGAESV